MDNITISRSEYIELLRYKEMATVLEDLLHEPAFKQSFVNRVLEAEKRVNKGENVQFKSVKDMSKYLDTVEE